MRSDDTPILFKALGDANRMEIVRTIAKNPGITANKLLKTLHIAQSTLSHHMRVLTNSGLVTVTREGKWSHYALSVEALDALDRFVNALRADRSQRARRLRMLSDIRREAGENTELVDAVDELVRALDNAS